ncbi:MAG: hypothetical protein Q8R15_02150 [Candidatus Micrarchaeota archaeon]|nr:hypothetical protein [Candidatus Micrarchaeota archaeon]
MENVTLDTLYHEVKRMRQEMHDLRVAVIPELEISESERKELRSIFNEMQKGKEKDWREIAR